ncbi:MAG: AAA family ATPase, partial [Planctomycetota bacterium]
NFMGEGMEKLLSLIVAIAHSPNRIILLDEIENGLHYSIIPKIWEAIGKALRKYNCQLITTTHSRECLEAAHEGLSEMPEDFRYIRLHRKDDEISAKLSNYEMIGTAIRTNLEVR